MARILIIEDAEDIRMLLTDLLESMGHTTLEAGDGLTGVRLALSERPDLIISDLMMPAASGESALQFIRGTAEIADLPVLVLSAHSDVRRIASEAGADAWLSKPVEMKHLREQVQKLLAKPRNAAPAAPTPSS